MRDIGQSQLDYDSDKLDTIADARRADQWFFIFEVLVNWTYRDVDNERKVKEMISGQFHRIRFLFVSLTQSRFLEIKLSQ